MKMRALLSAFVVLMLVAGSPFLANAGAAEDTMITTKVKTKLTTDRVKNLVSVNVDTKNGVVHLKGTVPNEQAKAEAERLAKDTDGVISVTNDIKVSPPKN
jgi:hyperosmotically inducible protein